MLCDRAASLRERRIDACDAFVLRLLIKPFAVLRPMSQPTPRASVFGLRRNRTMTAANNWATRTMNSVLRTWRARRLPLRCAIRQCVSGKAMAINSTSFASENSVSPALPTRLRAEVEPVSLYRSIVNRQRFDVIVDFDPRTEHARGCSVSSKPLLDCISV
jgi:hypothetical protein